MVKILCELRICTNVKNTQLFEKRLEQYINGTNKFLELNKKYIDNGEIDVYITDNTIPEDKHLSKSLLDIIPNNIKIIHCLNNNYGCFNKGAGDIEQWLYCKKLIEKYDYFIHFEPRQLLIDNYFIDNFLDNPRNLFTLGGGKKHFNTGLFCIQSNLILDFINKYPPETLVKKTLSIEYVIYNYFIKNHLEFEILDKMDLLWFDVTTKRTYHM